MWEMAAGSGRSNHDDFRSEAGAHTPDQKGIRKNQRSSDVLGDCVDRDEVSRSMNWIGRK
jgi:hypothetical protein